jgi:hypothetical protein
MKINTFAAWKQSVVAGGVVVWLAQAALASVPLNNLEGAGGVAFNPLAYPSGQNKDAASSNAVDQYISKPQFGVWYVRLGSKDIDWNALGASITVLDRLELSYGYEAVALGGALNIHKHNVGAKLLLVPENAGGYNFVPAVSVGAIWKKTSNAIVPDTTNSNDNAVDFYAVATKLITQTPLPVLLSAGVLSSKEYVTGVLGFDDDRKLTGFANVDVILPLNVAVGVEFKEGEKYDKFENANYWDAHLAWIANKNLTLVAAYVNAGSVDSTTAVGLGSGLVLSAQYAF